MDKRVTVLLPNGRRQSVNVTENTTLLVILETVCAKYGYDSEEHCLKFHNKEVSLTQMFRFSGLPNNCLLEMEPTERRRALTTVIVCVQLEDGSRMQREFMPAANIWEVVQDLCGEQTKHFESPVAIYMRSEVIGKEHMQKTTLKSLGILEGRAMLRVIDKKPEELKTQANVYKRAEVPNKLISYYDEQPQTSRSAAIIASGAGTAGGGGFAVTSNLIKSLKRNVEENNDNNISSNEPSKTAKSEEFLEKPKYDWGTGLGYTMQNQIVNSTEDVDDEMSDVQEEALPEVHIIGPRQAVVFSLDAMQKHIDDLPDSFFDLTENDLKMVLRDLKRASSGTENEPLMTARLRELERQKQLLNKLNQYKDCVLRVQFPDRHVLQGIFKPHEQISRVKDFVREFLVYPDEIFHLFTIPPKKILSSDATLLESDFVPNAVVHFAYENDALNNVDAKNYIHSRFLEQLTSEEGAHYAVQKYRLTRMQS